MTRILAAAVAGLLVSASASGQPAHARLELVPAASVDSPSAGVDLGVSYVCLEGSGYIFAVKRHADAARAIGMAAPVDDAADGPSASVRVRDYDERNEWGWTLLVVDEPACFEVLVRGGRVRLYRLAVRVDW